MKRFTYVFATIGVCALATVVVSKQLKFKALTPVGPGITENPEGDGMVHIKFKEGPNSQSDISVHISNFLPSTTYGVQLDPGITDPLAITTNPAGNGQWSGSVSFDVTQFNPTVRIFRWDGVIATISNVSFDELRAIGCASGNCPVGQACSVDSECDDTSPCTTDTCNGGFCFHALVTCDDGDPCTADFCNPLDGSCENDALPNCVP